MVARPAPPPIPRVSGGPGLRLRIGPWPTFATFSWDRLYPELVARGSGSPAGASYRLSPGESPPRGCQRPGARLAAPIRQVASIPSSNP